eukprot:scaffold80013_cov69-Phaeocystis_antarctica.AAC.3
MVEVGGAAALELVVHCSPCTLLPEGAVETFAQCTADWRRRVKRESGPRRTSSGRAGWIVKDKKRSVSEQKYSDNRTPSGLLAVP